MTQSRIEQRRDSQGGILALEIGELAAWIALGYGHERPGRRWRAQFTAPPSLDDLLERVQEGACEIVYGAVEGVGVASWASPLGAGSGYLPKRDGGDALIAGLHDLFGAPVVMRHAVEAAALSEFREVVEKRDGALVYIHLGREVLCAIVSDGAVIRGAHGLAGQIGHWQVTGDGPRCACGQPGHLNPLCSSQGFVRLAIGLVAQDEDALAAANTASGFRVEALTAQRVVALAHEGVVPLRALVERSADALGVAMARIALLTDPAHIVLGGPLGVAGQEFITGARMRMTADLRAVFAAWPPPDVEPARLEPGSALAGAWLLARERITRPDG